MRFFVFIFFTLFFGLVAPRAQAEVFFTDMPDVPVMPGMVEETTDQLSFGNASGRVVEAVAVGQALSASAVMQFYNETLPQLGWQAKNPAQFVRGAESLQIMLEREGTEQLRVRVVLSPTP